MELQGSWAHLLLGERQAQVYQPPGYSRETEYPVVYVQDGESFARNAPEILKGLEEDFVAATHRPFLLVALSSADRDREYTPWFAKGFSPEYGDFAGGGDAYLQELVQVCKPTIDRELSTLPDPQNTGMVGLSLGGLISLYSLSCTSVFGRVVSISGSCWYPNLLEYLEEHPPLNREAQILLTCGKYEGRSRFSMQQDAMECTQKAAAILQEQLGEAQVTLRADNGKHHDKQVSRYRGALRWFSQRIQSS